MKYILLILIPMFINAGTCNIPKEIKPFVKLSVKQPTNFIGDTTDLCIKNIEFTNTKEKWHFLLVWNKTFQMGPFFYLPHNDEKSAFKTALYSTRNFGGGFLAVQNNYNRNFKGIDPNRNFKKNNYTRNIITTIDVFRDKVFPYASLHNNANGYSGNGGKGHVSMLKKSSSTLSLPAGKIRRGSKLGLEDEDTMVYLVGHKVKKDLVQKFHSRGINVKYEIPKRTDYSMSNYVLFNLNSVQYINIETEKGDYKTQVEILKDVVEYFFNKYK